MQRIAGGLFVLAGAYLAYYWARVWVGPAATLAYDPIVGAVLRFTGRLVATAASSGVAIVAAATLLVLLAAAASGWQWRRPRQPDSAATPGGDSSHE